MSLWWMPVSGVDGAQRPSERPKRALLKCRVGTDGPHWTQPPPPLYVAAVASNCCSPFLILDRLPWLKAQVFLKCSAFFLKWFSGSTTERLPEHSLSILSPSPLCFRSRLWYLSNFTAVHKFCSMKLGSKPLAALGLLLPFVLTHRPPTVRWIWFLEGAAPSPSMIYLYLLKWGVGS